VRRLQDFWWLLPADSAAVAEALLKFRAELRLAYSLAAKD
jgi:hypothetical protein